MSSTKRSQIWLHFSAIDAEKKVKCLYCDQKLSVANKSTCSLIRHINKKHSIQHIAGQAHIEAENIDNNMTYDIQIDALPSSTSGSGISSNESEAQKLNRMFYNKNVNMKTPATMKGEIWSHFSAVDGENKVKCLHCDQPLIITNKSPDNLIRHMNKKHPSELIVKQEHPDMNNVNSYSTNNIQIDTSSTSINTNLLDKKRNGMLFAKTIKKKYPSRLKSQIWSHFSGVDKDNRVKCLYCDQKLSFVNKSTCNLIRHINKKHLTEHLDMPYSESNSSMQVDNQPTGSSGSPRLSSNGPESQKTTEFSFNKIINPQKQKRIDRQLVRMITKRYHPFSVVEDTEFVKLISLLNPIYKLPTRKSLSHSLIPAIYNETVKKVKSRLKRAFAVCLSLTADKWMSRAGENFYAITAHYIVDNNEGMGLDSDLLECVSFTEHHTAEHIANKLKDIIAEWEIADKVTVIVSDNADIMKAAVDSGEWRHWCCFSHSLNLIMQAGIKEIEVLVDKMKSLLSYFKRCSQANAQLKASQENMNLPSLKLKIESPTSWKSTLDLISRILSVKNAIIETIEVLNSSQNEEIQEIDDVTHEEWLIAEQAVQVLEVFDTVATVISSENKVTISSIFFFLKQLKLHLNKFEMNKSNLMPEINNMVAELLRELKTQFFSERDLIEDNDLIGLSTILDPRYKKFGFIDETKYEKMLEVLYREVAEMRPTDTPENPPPNDDMVSNENMSTGTSREDDLDDLLFRDFDNEVQTYLRPANAIPSGVVEVDKYLQEPLLPRKDANGVSTDPLLWWFQRKHIYPTLNQLVKTRLCIMATSVPCEKIFSHAGQVVNANKISTVVFLNYNLNNTF